MCVYIGAKGAMPLLEKREFEHIKFIDLAKPKSGVPDLINCINKFLFVLS